MKEITEYIDQFLKDSITVDCAGFHFFGLAELVTRGAQTYPITVNDREQVSIRDKNDGIIFHRFISGSLVEVPDMSFGSGIEKQIVGRLRTILAFKAGKFSEEFLFEFIRALPRDIDLIDEGFEYVNIGAGTIITDQATIYQTEFGGGDYEKHILTWNIYAIEYDVEFLKCA